MVMKNLKYYLYALLIGAFSLSLYSCNEEEDDGTNDGIENNDSSKHDTPKGGNIVGEWYFNSKMSEITIGEDDLLPILSTLIPDFDIQKAMNVLGEKVEFKEDGTLIIYDNEGTYSTNNGDLSISAILENGNPLNLKKGADFAALLEENAPESAEMIQKAEIKDFSYFADKDSLLLYMDAEVELLFAESTYFLPVKAVLVYGNVPQDNDSDKEDTENQTPEEGDKEDSAQNPIENPTEEAKKGGDIVGQWAINDELTETVIGDEASQGMMAFIPEDFDLNQVVNVLGDEVTFNEDGTLLADGKEGTFVTDNGTLSITTTPIEGGNPMTINGEADLKPIVDNLFPDYAEFVQSAKMTELSYVVENSILTVYVKAEIKVPFTETTIPVQATLVYDKK